MTKPKKQRRDYEADLVSGLIELMEAGTNPWQREWSAASNTPHTNLTTGAAYKGSNPALLELQMQIRGSSIPLWIPGGQGKAKGWRPKRGSKACCICMPMTITKSKTDDNGDPIITNGEVEMVRSTFFAYKGGTMPPWLMRWYTALDTSPGSAEKGSSTSMALVQTNMPKKNL
jgi:antirestriction protein ArdC